MTYYFAKVVPGPFDRAVGRVRDALKDEGFGVITEIDVQATIRSKLGEDFRPYLILGACNPLMAREALEIEDKIGTMLPCNVVVQALPDGSVEVAAVDPAASMMGVENLSLLEVADVVGGKLKAVISAV